MSQTHMITDPSQALSFMFAGQARFTLKSRKTGKHYTYRVSKAKDKDGVFFVGLLTDGDNTGDYTYIGFFKTVLKKHQLIAGRKGNAEHPSFKGLDWAVRLMEFKNEISEDLEFWHEGRCAKCARVLTDPVSIASGFGPECRKAA